MNKVYHVLAFIAALAITVSVLLTGVEVVAYYEPGFYETEYTKYNVKDDLHMEMDDILEVTDQMMAYLRGNRADLVVYTTVDGKEDVEFFGDQEKFHMGEVRNLFIGGLKLRTYLLLLAALIIGSLVCMQAKALRRMCIGFLEVFVLVLIAGGALVFSLSRDFTAGFTEFHHIFFNNDQWLFDPKTSLMINMLPEGFFTDCAIHIGVFFGIVMAVLAVLSVIGLVLTRDRKMKMRN